MKVRQGLLDLVLNHFTDTMGPLLEQNQDIASYNAVFVNTKPPSFVPCAEEEEREPSTHCSCMHQVLLVTCILLCYTKSILFTC